MEPTEVKEMLQTDKDKKPYKTISNFLTIFRNDSRFEKVRFDTMKEAPIILNSLHNRELWTDKDDSKSRLYLETEYLLPGGNNMKDAFNVLCTERLYSPIQEIIKSVEWDGETRCETFFIKWAKSPDNRYSRECGRLFFAEGISRAFAPGNKCDYVIVMFGDQGNAKSELARWLAVEDDFYLSLISIKTKEPLHQLCGRWIVELEELLATVDENASAEATKQFISNRIDNFRPPYGHYPIDHKRSCIFIGTTNRRKFLFDPTGNRRWFPLENNQDGEYLFAHKTECQSDILQCWAEMYHYWKSGSEMANTFPNRDLLSLIKEQQDAAEEDDPDIGLISDYLIGKEKVCLMQICQEALGLEYRKMKQKEKNAISAKLTGSKIGCKIKMTKDGTNKSPDRFPKPYGKQQAYIVPERFSQVKPDDSEKSD